MEKDCVGRSVGCQLMSSFESHNSRSSTRTWSCRDKVGQIGQHNPVTQCEPTVTLGKVNSLLGIPPPLLKPFCHAIVLLFLFLSPPSVLGILSPHPSPRENGLINSFSQSCQRFRSYPLQDNFWLKGMGSVRCQALGHKSLFFWRVLQVCPKNRIFLCTNPSDLDLSYCGVIFCTSQFLEAHYVKQWRSGGAVLEVRGGPSGARPLGFTPTSYHWSVAPL